VSEPLIEAEEVAEMIGMGSDWVYAEARANRIPHIRLGRSVRFRRSSIEAWLSALEAETLQAHTKRPRAAQTAGGMAAGGKS
jgi:excisionase family DNA binding protein